MHEKPERKTKKPEKIAKLKISLQPTMDASANALAAAGLKLGRQYSWANAATITKSGKFGY